MKRLLLEGDGGANGTFLRAGLVDELNSILCPAVDGAKRAPGVFGPRMRKSIVRAPVTEILLTAQKKLI